MKAIPAAFALAVAPLILAAQDAPATEAAPAAPAADLPELSMEQTAALRCGVAFGLVAGGQEAGDERALAFPKMEPRGLEYFVRTMAKLMDEKSLTRPQVQALARQEVGRLQRAGPDAVVEMMPNCLMLLEASGV